MPNPFWRRAQLDRVADRFSKEPSLDPDVPIVQSDEDLQDMWKGMETRVVKRRSLSVQEARERGKLGRKNIKKTDEEVWLEAGVYDAPVTVKK